MTDADDFVGFPSDAFTFLRELAENNNRDWFNANKPRYQDHILAPMSRFIRAIAPHLYRISPAFIADPKPHGGSMFRIYRDTRFGNNKSPYKEHIACQFRHNRARDVHAPGFYVQLEPQRIFLGGGIWRAPTEALGHIRDTLAEDPEHWRKITTQPAFVQQFGTVQGEQLKRVPRGFDPQHPLAEDLKRKTFFAGTELAPASALEAAFVDEVAAHFETAAPFMQFITTALALEW
ncbi:MAG: DUF2461 domain-containing protein [Gammaproteobacteria bacterium]